LGYYGYFTFFIKDVEEAPPPFPMLPGLTKILLSFSDFDDLVGVTEAV
jgi:hypothetical protein